MTDLEMPAPISLIDQLNTRTRSNLLLNLAMIDRRAQHAELHAQWRVHCGKSNAARGKNKWAEREMARLEGEERLVVAWFQGIATAALASTGLDLVDPGGQPSEMVVHLAKLLQGD